MARILHIITPKIDKSHFGDPGKLNLIYLLYYLVFL
jgi:hypothetical protein